MKTIGIFMLALSLSLVPSPATAQICDPVTVVECNQTYPGDTTGGPSHFGSYPGNCTGYSENGPEQYFRLDMSYDALVTVLMDYDDYFDNALAVLEDAGGDCSDQVCLGGDDSGNPETVEFTAVAGSSYYIVADGYYTDDYGAFTLEIRCENCSDADGDGHFAVDPECFSGDDCCDTGTESSIGCDIADPAEIHPGVEEICGNGIDEDCDGEDPVCPYCDPGSNAIACDTEVISRNDGPDSTQLVNDYACLLYSETGSEVAYVFTAVEDHEVRVRLTSPNADLALAVIPAAGVCDGAECIAGSDRVFGPGTESVLVPVEAGEDYFIVVDAWADTVGDFTLVIDCAGCADDDEDGHADMFCGGDDCDDQNLDIHPGATEACNHLDDDCDSFTDEDFDTDSDPLNCGDCGIECGPTELCDLGFCDTECHGSRENCNGACVDTTSNPLHCGGCNQPCTGDHALYLCVDSQCTIDACDPGWRDCDTLPGTGCEIDTTSDPLHCGDCTTECDPYDHGLSICRNGHCALGDCDPGWGNCDNVSRNGCETDLLTTNEHCGECDNPCASDRVCVSGDCSDTCPEGQDVCGGRCIDVASDPRNCGGCGRVCQFPNASDPGCEGGNCVLGTCDSGWGNCDDYELNGCEQRLNTPEHCRECHHACEYPHARGECDEVTGSCSMGSCVSGYFDCNDSDIDGCETHIAADEENCGQCGRECGRLESCIEGECTVTCEDGDDDGFADETCGGDDCNDEDRNISPGAPETCDGLDNNCDGQTDEGFDADGDGYKSCGEEPDCCDVGDENSLGCTPENSASIFPGANETCGNEVDEDCNGVDLECVCPDADRDGAQDAACGGTDCNDSDETIHPDAIEVCNQIDDDCDGVTDENNVCDTGESCGCAQGSSSSVSVLWIALAALVLCRRKP